MASVLLETLTAGDSKTPGKLFRECYDVTEKCLGNGMSGSVMAVVCKFTGKEFALKILDVRSDFLLSTAIAEEEALAAGLDCDNVVQMKDIFKEHPYHYIVMEKMTGNLNNLQCNSLPLDEFVAARMIRDVVIGLSFLHNYEVAHRDIKLENIFYSERLYPVKLGDYGLNSGFNRKPCCKDHGHHKFSDAVGTIEYMAPEVALIYLGFKGHYGKQCDMWSLGITLYALLTGDLPYRSERNEKACKCQSNIKCQSCTILTLNSIIQNKITLNENWRYISPEGQDLIMKLLHRDPSSRPTVDEVLEHPWILLNLGEDDD